MFGTLGLVCRGLANLLPVLVRELPVLPLEFFHILPDAYMSASTNKYANPRKKEKRSRRWKSWSGRMMPCSKRPVWLLNLAYEPDFFWITLQRWGHRGWEGGWDVESLPEKRVIISPVSTSTVDFKQEFQREICPVTWGGVWSVLYQFWNVSG